VLKSPLFGFDEEQLFKLAYDRKASLRATLRQKAADDPMFAAANRALDELEASARQTTPFAFYAHVLGPRKGRKRFLNRLGIEAADPLNEFLSLALDYERRETPSLQGFLGWIRVGQNEVKRDMEIGRDEVRVMTVHGAKGLEAKNVILIDATTVRPEGAYPPRLLETSLDGGSKTLIWGARKDLDVGPMANAREQMLDAAREEYRRLLYVGMTRAAERLVVCATKGVNKIPEGCWYDLVCAALQPLAVEDRDVDGDQIWRLRKEPLSTEAGKRQDGPAAIVVPEWLRNNAAPQKLRRRIVRPSDTGGDDGHRAGDPGDRDKALRRGTLLHRLMQALPDIAPERRAAAAKAYLAKQKDITDAERAELTAHALRILDDARFKPLFAPGSRAEISIAGELTLTSETIAVAGQIDRLAVTDSDVLIADYKTNHPPPARIADVPPAYIRQLALYRALLQKIYPAKSIRAALIWTETPELMELSSQLLDDALSHVTST